MPPDGPATTVHRVTLATDQGLAQVILEDAESVSFVDEALRRQIGEALDALGRHRRRRAPHPDPLTWRARGEREVTVAPILAEIPLWKTAIA